jgi:hypothetical protein
MDEKQSADEFLSSFLQKNIDVNGTGFMLRSVHYNKLEGIPQYPNLLFADFELWIKAAEFAYMATSSIECFSFRLHQSTTTVSADIKMQKSFEQFIYFLKNLQSESDEFNIVIKNYSTGFIQFWCKGLAHRLLRTPKIKRSDLSVSTFIKKCNKYADMLSPGNSYNLLNDKSVSLAKLIDKFSITRILFLLFKKIYSKPILD